MENNSIFQEIKEKGRIIRKIDDMFVKKIQEAIKLKEETDRNTEFRQELVVEFYIDSVWDDLIEVIKERTIIIKGMEEIFNKEGKYFRYTDMELNDRKVTVKLIKDWRGVYSNF